MKDKCDCIVGNFYGYDYEPALSVSGIYQEAVDALRSWNNIYKYIPNTKKPISDPSGYFDRRKGMFNMNIYCPNCGTKIDWKSIKKDIKEKYINDKTKTKN